MAVKLIRFVKREAVFSVALVLAVASAFLVPPSVDYLGYIDFRSLGLLLALMLTVAALQKQGLFLAGGNALLRRVKSVRQLAAVCILLPFVSSMLITNDVALITFVPFAIALLKLCDEARLCCPVVILQTVAANLGSMLTPLGNPQNLYLYSRSGMGIGEFLLLLLPYTAVALVLLLCSLLFLRGRDSIVVSAAEVSLRPRGILLPAALFLLCLLAVVNLLPWYVALGGVLLALLFTDRSLFAKADWFLLLTFVCFFVFVGNMSRIPAIHDFLAGIVVGNELPTAILASQVISNVPAAVLLSGFTGEYPALIVGVNLGGLGTLIASMASLISFRFYAVEAPTGRGRYLGLFTLVNLLFLAVLWLFTFVF